MSPEQVQGYGRGGSCDLYALTLVLGSRESSHVYATPNGGNADLEVISLGNIKDVGGAVRNDIGASLSP
jgi:hypothetical protein